MIHRTSKMIANYLFSIGIIDKKDIEIYIYGYETILSGIIDFCISLIFGLIFNRLKNVLIFFIMFITVRIYTGGYHSETYLKCKFLFSLIILSVLGLLNINIPFYLIVIILSLFLITIFYLAPIENEKKPLTMKEKKKYRRISMINSVIWSVSAIIFYFFVFNISVTIVSTSFFIMLLMIVEKYRKGGKLDEKSFC